MKVVSKPTVSMEETLRRKTVLYCKQLIGSALKMDVDEIDSSGLLSSLGIDSIMVGQINMGLQEYFDDISGTLFFELRTLDDLADHLVKTQRTNLLRLFGLGAEPEPQADEDTQLSVNPPVQTPVKLNPRLRDRQSRRLRVVEGPAPAAQTSAIDRRIAIIGISGLYPQARNLEEYWENLKSGKNCTSEIPAVRWRLDDFYESDAKQAVELGKSYSKWGGFIDQFSEFDASFFGISPLEALCIDPQERLFLQTSWLAMENAGYTRSTLRDRYNRKVGVFAGITRLGYNLYGSSRTIRENKFFPRTSFSSVANRLSYFLDIQGPSMPVDTMCSSSLTAIHEACEHIYRGECDMAFAGGVNLYLHPTSYVDLSAQGMLSKGGSCRSFGEGADGFVPGEGVGVVLLKSLARAIEDNDTIHGVILATHVNHGGMSNGYAVPNPKAQADVIRRAIDKTGISARSISYVEAHGTGTELGDSIEISALQQAFAEDTRDLHFCRLGSVKSNIGHCESAAGISGLTKVLLQMRHRQIVPSLHSESVNPHINLEKSPFVLNHTLTEWDPPVIDGQNKPRVAGISSFGAGGANAHVIVQEYVPLRPIDRPPAAADTDVAVLLSAATKEQLRQRAEDLLAFVAASNKEAGSAGSVDLSALAYTLQIGREAMKERFGCVVGSLDRLSEKLQTFIETGKGGEDLYLGQARQDKDTLSLFSADSDLKETVDKWISQKKLANLLKLWVKGLDLDWEKLYGETSPGRIGLPTYPFAAQRYWIDSLNIAQAAPGATARVADASVSVEPAVPEKWRFTVASRQDVVRDGVGPYGVLMEPREKIELFLRQALSLHLKIPLEDIAKDKNFVELGVDSIGITKLIRLINQLLKADISPSVLFEYPDIHRLAGYLLASYPVEISALIVEKSERRNVQPATRKDDGSPSGLINGEKKTSSDVLIAMQPMGDGPPVFGMPGGPGNALVLLPLSRALGDKRPFYALQAVGLDGKTPPLDSMEKAARLNVDVLKTVQATGPYTLLGYSNGGVVAYEMAKVLLDRGEPVESLILLDTLCPLQRVNSMVEETVEICNSFFMTTLGVDLGLSAGQLEQVPEHERGEFLYKMITAKGLDITEREFSRTYDVAKASFNSCRSYKPTRLPREVDVILCRATEAYPDMPADYGWNRLLPRPVRTADIKANHISIVSDDAAGEAAKAILRLLNKKK